MAVRVASWYIKLTKKNVFRTIFDVNQVVYVVTGVQYLITYH